MKASDLDNMADPPDTNQSDLSSLPRTDIFAPLRSYNDFLIKSLPKPRPINPAQWAYERLGEYIKDFEAELDDEHEIGARLVSFGQSVTFHIESIGYYGPDILTFHGRTETMAKVQLIQHISQLSVLLIAVEKQQDKPRRIGFLWDKEKPQSNP